MYHIVVCIRLIFRVLPDWLTVGGDRERGSRRENSSRWRGRRPGGRRGAGAWGEGGGRYK